MSEYQKDGLQLLIEAAAQKMIDAKVAEHGTSVEEAVARRVKLIDALVESEIQSRIRDALDQITSRRDAWSRDDTITKAVRKALEEQVEPRARAAVKELFK